jgi:hypothetical protein
MSSIIKIGHTYHGISVFGRGVFTNDKYGYVRTYAGQCKDGHACGLGVVTYSRGSKDYAEYGPDGEFDGRWLQRNAHMSIWYRLYERGKENAYARVYANGDCQYNRVACAPDDPRLLALIALVAPVEVRPAARAPHQPRAPHLPPSHCPMDRPALLALAGARRRRGHRGASPIPQAVAGGCATQPNSSRKARPRSDAGAGCFAVLV